MSLSIDTQSTQSIFPSKASSHKKQKMSITQTYFLAHTARGKLSKEASRADHELRLLVGHANLLDSLMLDLADAEQEQERWFNQTVSGATKAAAEEPKQHIQWADTVVEDPEEDWDPEDAESSDSEDESEYDEEEEEEEEEVTIKSAPISIRRTPSPAATITTREIQLDEDFDEDDEEDYGDLALTRTSSRHPPELTSDSEEDSEDDSMPPSPPQQTFDAFTERQRQAIATTSFYDKKAASSLSEADQHHFFEDGFYLPERQAAMIAAY